MELAKLLEGHRECTETSCCSTGATRCRTIAANNQTPDFAIDDYYMFECDNVVDVGVQPHDHYGWDIAFDTSQSGPIDQTYFCVDTIYNETWPHWVDESAIYLLLFHKLRKFYPNLKLYSIKRKIFKYAMYKAFDIAESDIVYTIENTRNKFIFPQYISLADHTHPFLFMKHMSNFYKYIVSKCPHKEKDIDLLYLPRGSKENSKGTDRVVPMQKDLLEILAHVTNVVIYHTDETQNMIDQWDLVRRAKTILLNEGGNHGINGFFAQNSKIVVLGGNGNACHFQNPSPALMYYDSIKRGNTYYHISYNAPATYVLHFIAAVEHGQVPAVQPSRIDCWRKCTYCKYQDYSQHALI